MKKQALLYIAIAALLLFLALFLIFSLTDTIKFNTATHLETEYGEHTLTFKGTKSEVRKLIIKRNGDKVASFNLNTDTSAFVSDDMSIISLPSDASSTLLLIPYTLDSDGDKHYRLLALSDSEVNFFEDTDIANPDISSEDLKIISEDTSKKELGQAINGEAPPYEQYVRRTLMTASSQGIMEVYEIKLTYYSETNIYCISESYYDADLGTLGASDDDWLLPNEYEAERAAISELFTLPIP